MHRGGIWTGSESFVFAVRMRNFRLGSEVALDCFQLNQLLTKPTSDCPVAIQPPSPIALR
jgi:hypothetical protein